jgi:hypothetical protein
MKAGNLQDCRRVVCVGVVVIVEAAKVLVENSDFGVGAVAVGLDTTGRTRFAELSEKVSYSSVG